MDGINNAQTAADLRRQLHTMKFKDRMALAANTTEKRTNPSISKFTQSQWFTALLTGLSIFGLLYIANPLFVQEKRGKYETAKPSVKRIAAWSILAALLVGLGPMLYQKFLSK